MILKIMCLKDTITGEYGAPGLVHNIEEAKRQVQLLYKGSKSFQPMTKDYQLIILGDYDNESGVIVSHVDFICNCIDLVGDLNG